MNHKEANFTPDKVRLLGNRVLLEQLPKETKSAGGIHLLPQFSDDRMQWRVVAVGPGKKSKKGGEIVPLEVKPGDRVLCRMDYDFIALDNGLRVVDAKHLEMKWDYSP